MFGGTKLLKFYTQSFIYLVVLGLSIIDSSADDQVEQIRSVVSSLESLTPEVPTNCPQGSTSVDAASVEGSITTKTADSLFGFIAGKDNDSPVQFYFLMRSGINPDGTPSYSPVKKQRSDVRLLDSALRGGSSGAQTLLGLTELELDNFLTERTILNETEREDAKIILEMTKYSTETEILNSLKERTKGFSYQRKLQLLASVGNNLLGGYDYDRLDKSDSASEGVVTTDDMFHALRRSLLTGEKVGAGVCRDMHLSMAKMARAMGIQNAYGVSYATRTGAHLILTTTPDSYGRVSTVNYGKIEHSTGKSGAGALELQGGMPSWGLGLYITNGTTNTDVISIPTRLAQALNLASGGDEGALFSGELDNGKVLRTGARTNFGSVLFSSEQLQDGTDGQVSGIFYQLDKSPFSFLRFNGAVGYMESQRAAGDENLYESGLYFRSSTTLGEYIPLSETLSLRPFATHHYSYLNSCRRTDSNPDCVEDDLTVAAHKRIRQTTFSTNIILGTGLRFQDEGFTSELAYQLRAQSLLDDARDGDSERSLRPSQHQISLDVDYTSQNFNLGGYGRLILSDLQDQVVKTYQAGAHVRYNPIRLSLMGEAQGRIDSPGRVVPAWIPGSENRQTFRLTKGFELVDSSLGVEYQRSDDFPSLDSGFFIFRLGQ